MEGSTLGWSTRKRRAEINRIFDHVISQTGLGQTKVYELIAHRVGVKLNTVQGWRESRKPPSWPVLDVLRYEYMGEPVVDRLALLVQAERDAALARRRAAS